MNAESSPAPINFLPTTRRRFLAATASVAAFSIVKPVLVRGTEVNSRITVGVIGLGGRGGWIANYVAKHGGFQITAVADYFDSVTGLKA